MPTAISPKFGDIEFFWYMYIGSSWQTLNC